MIRAFDIEEVVGWTGLRAMREAVDKAPEIPVTEDMFISVEIRMHSETWPGKTSSGRRKSTLIGTASCIYRGAKDSDQ
jgi:hypothetical protein